MVNTKANLCFSQAEQVKSFDETKLTGTREMTVICFYLANDKNTSSSVGSPGAISRTFMPLMASRVLQYLPARSAFGDRADVIAC